MEEYSKKADLKKNVSVMKKKKRNCSGLKKTRKT